jgi:mannose-6-phosphate isomerase-like protein (cupin superfamily)
MKTTALSVLLIVGYLPVATAAEPPPTDVLLIDHAKVDDAFGKGQMVLANSSFKVLAGRRVAPGEVEIHEHDTDIFYVLDGSATFVAGGTAVAPKPTAPGEIRAREISGGAPHHLVKGDVIVIPSGVPHQFTAVSGTFLYYVVKVTR